jgi:hemolysin activation/secretion protein
MSIVILYLHLCFNRIVPICVGFLLVVFTCTSVQGQGALGIDPTRERRVAPPLLEDQPYSPPPGTILPPIPLPQALEAEQLPLIRVFVRDIKVTGNTVFGDEELAEVTRPYKNRDLTNEDLEALRLDLTLYYVNNGYVNSGAVIPDQTVADGVIEFHVIEGELTSIGVEGNKWFRDRYIRSRLALGAGPPLNINSLQQRLRLLQLDSRIERLNADLLPGVKPGESILDVRVKDRQPYGAGMEFNNYQSPTIGAERRLATVTNRNLLGLGDILSISYGRSEGLERQINALYTIPITARDTTLTLQYRRDDSSVVQEPFRPLNIVSEEEVYNITLRHPFYRTVNHEFAMSFTGERLHSETFLLHAPFSFSAGAHRGKSNVTALRFTQEWTHRSLKQVFAARSRFSVGIDAFGATNNSSSVVDGQFFTWLGQFQWARRLTHWDIQPLLRTDIQLANESLLPLEQIAVGGRYSVRGYRENQMVRDDAIIASFETRVPVIRNKRWADYVELVPFVDYGKAWFGRAWNRKIHTPDPKAIASVGVGVRWAVTLPKPFQIRPQFECYWGHRLNNIETSSGEHDLQDDGVHFQFSIGLF